MITEKDLDSMINYMKKELPDNKLTLHINRFNFHRLVDEKLINNVKCMKKSIRGSYKGYKIEATL